MANIKISQLPSIGNGLTASTILPVVNTTGTLTTDKVAVGNIANFVLTQAGNTLPPAFVANVSYNVVNAAQPNITSVGTLTRLSINGVGNLTIPGGTNGYVLQTDGAGNLSWTAQTGGGGNGTPGGSNSQLQFNLNGSFAGDPDLTWDAGNNQLNTVNFAASTATIYGNVNAINVNASGNVKPNAIYTDHYYYSNGQAFSGGGNGSPGGSNTQVQFNDGGVFGGNTGFTFNKTTGIFSSPFLAGNGNGLSNIQGANVSGAVTYATTANTVAGGNVVGAVQYATTANSVAVANVVGIGNIATVALSGSTSNVLYGNGVFAAVPSGNPFDQDLNTTDNVQFANVTSTEAIRFSNSGNIVGALGYAPTFVSIEGYGSNSVNITTNDVNTWAFNGDGTLSLPGNVAGSAGNVLIDSADDNFEVRGAQAVNFEANAVVNIYTDTSNNAYQWQFGDDGNLTLPANNSSINYANGQPYGGGGGATDELVNGDNSFVLDNDGNVVFQGAAPGDGVDRGLVWDYGANANGVNSQVRQDNNGITVRAWTENGGGGVYSAPVNIVTNQDANTKTWTFDGQGNLTLPGNLILLGNIETFSSGIAFTSALTSIDTANSIVIITVADNVFTDPYSGPVTISGVSAPLQVNGNWYYQALDGNQFQLYTNSSLSTPVDGSAWPGYAGPEGTAVGTVEYSNLTVQGGNVSVGSNDETWVFDSNGVLNTPNNSSSFVSGRIQTANGYPTLLGYGSGGHGGPELDYCDGDDPANIFENPDVYRNVLYINDNGLYVGMNENNNANVANGARHSWLFDPTGNLTLPGNTFAVNYANGAQVQISGGSGYPNGFTYVLDDRLVSGEFEVNNSSPANVSIISINPDTGNISVDELMTYLNGKNTVVTLADTSGNQASYSVNSISPFIVGYNGYKAVFTKQWGDDPGFSKIAFFKDTANATAITQTDTNDDEFTINISGSSDLLGVAIIYTDNQDFIPAKSNLIEYFEYFVDNILIPADGNIADIKTFFYDQIINTAPLIAAWGEDPWNLEFYTNGVNSLYTSVASTTGGSGTGFTANIIPAGDGSYRILSFTGGTGYQVYDNITFSGSDLGGTSPTHDLVLEVATVNGSGAVLTFGQTGVSAGIWPTNNISDGGSDIYDTGNFLNTNLQPIVPYSDGELQNTGAFNTNNWFVGYAYGQFIFFGDNTGNQVSSFGTHGETGADGDGFRETGDLSPVEYFDLNVNSVLSYSSGMTLTGGTYQISFDNGGVNTNGVVFDQNSVNTITTTVGDLYIKAADDVRLQPFDLLQLRGGDKTLPGSSGGYVNMSGGQGSPAVTTPGSETNAASGGDIEIYGGTAGYDGSNSSLGAQGGRVYIEGGSSSGNNNGGEIRLMGGNPSGTGTRGNIVFNLDYDTVFKYDGSIIFPTKTVDLHNGGSQNAQLLQFGNGSVQAVITGPTPAPDTNAQRLIIQGQRGNGTYSEGGDVYLWAGDADTNGGDIKIYAGDADNVSTGYGGYINIDGGTGYNSGGPVEITGGQSTGSQGAPARISGGPGLTFGGDANISGGTGGNDNGGNVNVIGGYGANNGGQVNITGGQSALGLPGYGNVLVGAGASTWTFNNEGNLVLPGNTFSVNYANGDPVSLGSAALGNLTVSNITLQGIGSPYGDDGLNLAPGPDSTANLQYFRVRGGDYPTHIHFDTGNNNAYDQYFGDDNKYLKLGLGLAGNVSIGTYQDGGVGALEWIFDSNGNLVLAGGNSVIQSIANSSLDPLNPNVSTMVLTPDQNYNGQALVLDPTAPGHIHLRAPGANIDEPVANLFLGGENSSFEVGYYTGSAPNVFIHSNDNTWTFDTSGSLIFPRDASGNTDPYLVINGGTDPSIGSIDASQAGPANLSIVSNYLNLTGYSGATVSIHADDGEIATDANMVLTTNNANVGNTYSWTFDNTGVVSTAGEFILQAVNDTVNLQTLDAGSGNIYSAYLGTNGGWYLGGTEYLNGWLNITPASGNADINAPAGNINIKPAFGVTNSAGKSLNLLGGDADQSDFYTGTGGAVNITGGLGSSNDGGGGGPGGNINITAGESSDPAGHAGNVNITSELNQWTFDYTGNLTLPGNTFSVNYANGTQVSLGGGYGNSNVATFLGSYGSNTISTTGNVRVGQLSATATDSYDAIQFSDNGTNDNGSIRVDAGSNMVIKVPSNFYVKRGGSDRVAVTDTNSDFMATTNVTIQSNKGGTTNTWSFYANGVLSAPGNITTSGDISATNIGNVAALNLDGSSSNVLYGNGTFAPASGGSYGDSNVVTLLSSFGSNTVSTTGNVTAGNLKTGGNVVFTANTSNIVFNNTAYINGSGNAVGRDGSIMLVPYTGAGSSFPGVVIGGAGRLIAPNGSVHQIFNSSDVTFQVAVKAVALAATSTTTGGIQAGGGIGVVGNAYVGGTLVRTGAVTSVAWTTSGTGLRLPTATYTDNSTAAGTQTSSYVHLVDAPALAFSNAVTVTNAATMYIAAPTAGANATITNPFAIIANGNVNVTGVTSTGIGALNAGVTSTLLPNTVASFNSNVNSYTQVTLQNKNTGADATSDYIATADNGSDTVNYMDVGIINSGYDANTPTNSLGNIVFAADSYMYAQGNTSNASQSGGNLAIGTTVPGKNVKIFAGGVNNNSIIANIGNTGIAVTGNLTATGNITANNFSGNISITGNVTGTSPNVSLVAGSYTYTFDNAGILTIPATGGNEGGEIDFTKAPNSSLTGTSVVFDQYVDRFRFFEGGGTNRGVYIDLSQAAASVGTLLNNRVSSAGLALNTSLAFDNLAIQIKTQSSGVWIFAGTVTGSATYQYSISYQLSGSNTQGTIGTMSATTTQATLGSSAWFFNTAGTSATVMLTDTTNTKMYRVTWMTTTASSPYGNYVSIERVV